MVGPQDPKTVGFVFCAIILFSVIVCQTLYSVYNIGEVYIFMVLKKDYLGDIW